MSDLETAARVKDPVCGMSVDPATSPHHAAHDGLLYHFCSNGCRTKFEADPDRYLAPASASLAPAPAAAVAAAAAAAKDTVYTCPMDPEVRQTGPGACPICGMALEPAAPTADAGPNPELADMRRRLWLAAALTIPVFLLAMAGISGPASDYAQLLLSAPVVFWAGAPFLERAWRSVVSRRLNMFTLVALGALTAWFYSAAAILAATLFPAGFRAGSGAVDPYFEAAAVITTLVLLGQVLELRARGQTGEAIRALLKLTPTTATRIRGNTDETIPLDQIHTGDQLRVRPGESVPVDGTILGGQSAVDESLVTGESMPVARTLGDPVIGGTINGAGSFVMRADTVGAGTVLARIVATVADAQRSRAPIQRLADRVAAVFVPAVLAAAALTFAAWLLLGPAPAGSNALIAAVSVIVIACPCALGLATPMSVTVGLGRGAQMGVLVRSAETLERIAAVTTLLVDKTGTLTEGRPTVTSIHPAPRFDEPTVLTLAAALERNSEHPLAAAIIAATHGRELPEAKSVTVDAGGGIAGQVAGRTVLVGSAPFLAAHSVDPSSLADDAARLRTGGATAVFVAIDGAPAATVGIADPIKPTTPAAIAALHAEGIDIVMVTGDHRGTAEAIARRLGITRIEAEIRPDTKRELVKQLRDGGAVVAMAGDGINDAPALAEADVGIAMGTGTAVAIGSAGITLLGGDLSAILRARALGRAVMRNVRQNLVFAFAYNVVGIPVAAGVLYPWFGILLSPMLAAAAMSLSSVCVITNALRLRHTPIT